MSEESVSGIPRHVAIVMDGNGRWAKSRFLPRTAGHKQGVGTTKKVIEACSSKGVEVLTLFAFSSENWSRPESEVSTLMELFVMALKREAKGMADNNIRLIIIGDKSAFPEKLQTAISETESLTAHCTGMTLLIAANYGGRFDITQAVRKLATRLKTGELDVTDISEDLISQCLWTSGLPDPDLFIRTGGEKRISNFLLWQIAYAELYFSDVLWPAFGIKELEKAFESFANRERRFGKTSEQVSSHA
ncbi:MAG: isoprenyl transferase [bacterium]